METQPCAVTDFKIRTSTLPWKIKHWGRIAQRTKENDFNFTDISLVNHSCKCNLFLITESEYSTLKVVLCDYKEVKGRFSISVSLKNDELKFDTKESYVDLRKSDSNKLVKFILPPISKTPTYGKCWLNQFVKDDMLTIYISIEDMIEHKLTETQ